jgi:hypothetical protein
METFDSDSIGTSARNAKGEKASHSAAEPQPKSETVYRRDAESAEKFVAPGEEINHSYYGVRREGRRAQRTVQKGAARRKETNSGKERKRKTEKGKWGPGRALGN